MQDINSSQIELFIKKIVKMAKDDMKVVGVIVFGSYIQKKYFKDVDIALISIPNQSEREMLKIRLNYLKEVPDYFDIQIFQTLSLAIQKDILNGNVLYETTELYDIAYETVKEYEDFRKYRDDYIKEVLNEN